MSPHGVDRLPTRIEDAPTRLDLLRHCRCAGAAKDRMASIVKHAIAKPLFRRVKELLKYGGEIEEQDVVDGLKALINSGRHLLQLVTAADKELQTLAESKPPLKHN